MKVSGRFTVLGITQYIDVFIHCFGSSRLVVERAPTIDCITVGMLLSKTPEFSSTNAASCKTKKCEKTLHAMLMQCSAIVISDPSKRAKDKH